MNNALKLIIIGFALMIFGGIIFATFTIAGVNSIPKILLILLNGFFLGPILILLGVIKYPNEK